jgi:lipid A disaccharide synthetase
MGWIISTIILTVIATILSFALWNLLKKNESLEDFITKQSEAINQCDKRLKEIDDKNIFYADDQIGWFFKEVQKIQEALNEFTLK